METPTRRVTRAVGGAVGAGIGMCGILVAFGDPIAKATLVGIVNAVVFGGLLFAFWIPSE